MFRQLNDLIFVSGWFISAFLFGKQLVKLYQTKQYEGLDTISFVGFFLLNANSTVWMYLHKEYFCMPATIGLSLFSLAIVLKINKLKGDKPDRTSFPYDAVLWDLDGTTHETQSQVHAPAEAKVLAHYGIHVEPESISKRFAGIPTKKVFMELAQHIDPNVLIQEKWNMVRRMLKEDDISPIYGIAETLELLHSAQIPGCIASASPRWYIEQMMKKPISTNPSNSKTLDDYFGLHYVSAEEVENPKPAPDVFLRAAEILKVNPKRCLVIGDGYSDVAGATAAGMDVIYLGEYQERVAQHKNAHICASGHDIFIYIKKLFK